MKRALTMIAILLALTACSKNTPATRQDSGRDEPKWSVTLLSQSTLRDRNDPFLNGPDNRPIISGLADMDGVYFRQIYFAGEPATERFLGRDSLQRELSRLAGEKVNHSSFEDDGAYYSPEAAVIVDHPNWFPGGDPPRFSVTVFSFEDQSAARHVLPVEFPDREFDQHLQVRVIPWKLKAIDNRIGLYNVFADCYMFIDGFAESGELPVSTPVAVNTGENIGRGFLDMDFSPGGDALRLLACWDRVLPSEGSPYPRGNYLSYLEISAEGEVTSVEDLLHLEWKSAGWYERNKFGSLSSDGDILLLVGERALMFRDAESGTRSIFSVDSLPFCEAYGEDWRPEALWMGVEDAWFLLVNDYIEEGTVLACIDRAELEAVAADKSLHVPLSSPLYGKVMQAASSAD